MNDKELMENLLLNVKGECDLLLHGAEESSTPEVHSAFTSALSEALCMQNKIYNKMAEKGWYPASVAEAQKITEVKNKFSAM